MIRTKKNQGNENQPKKTSAIPNQRDANGPRSYIRLTAMLLVNGEVKETVEADVDPLSDALTVFKSIVTTDQLKTLLEMNSETSIEYVLIATSTGTNSTI